MKPALSVPGMSLERLIPGNVEHLVPCVACIIRTEETKDSNDVGVTIFLMNHLIKDQKPKPHGIDPSYN
ncbi:hypothetical protein WG66_011592 [Moniliophthora roreri]|nr:hypothetical protein WG66_011592 [Moniliophthora roreri]